MAKTSLESTRHSQLTSKRTHLQHKKSFPNKSRDIHTILQTLNFVRNFTLKLRLVLRLSLSLTQSPDIDIAFAHKLLSLYFDVSLIRCTIKINEGISMKL